MNEINHGVIPGPTPTDFIAGTIPWENRNPSGNWYPYLVQGEHQSFGAFDCMGCVSYAVNNICEIQIKHQTGEERNFSDRFLAKMSGTTFQGNRVSTVLDTWRNDGFINENLWPVPPNPNWDTFYAPIPTNLVQMAANNKNLYDLKYEYIIQHDAATIKHHLQHAPLLITIPGHEITGIVVDADDTYLTVLDDYTFNVDPNQPFVRKILISDLTDIYKAVLTVNNMNQFKTQNKNGELRIVLQASDIEQWKALCKIYGKNPDQIDEVINN